MTDSFMTHKLKTWPDEFRAIEEGLKTSEFRFDDRGFKVGDVLLLEEYFPEAKRYTGKKIEMVITHIVKNKFGIPNGYAMLSFQKEGELDEVNKLEKKVHRLIVAARSAETQLKVVCSSAIRAKQLLDEVLD